LRSILRRRRRGPPARDDAGLAAALLEGLDDGVVACGRDGRLVVCNGRAREILGLADDRIASSQWGEQLAFSYRERGRRAGVEHNPLSRALAGEHLRDVELEIRCPKGRSRIVNVRGQPITDHRGRGVGAVIILQDVTDRARLQDTLRLQAAIAANMAEGVALIRSSDGVIVYVNDALGTMFGYRTGELVGQHISVINAPADAMPEDRAAGILSALERDGAWRGEVHNLRKDGTRLSCEVSVSPFEHAEHGTVWIAVHTDRSEREAAEDALREADERFRKVF
jgi:PAS domain S-box-containing protein